MLSLDAMVLMDDWKDGARAGKPAAAHVQLLAANYAVPPRREDGSAYHAGALAVVVYITVPWTLRITTHAYAEERLVLSNFSCHDRSYLQSDPDS